MPDGLGELPEGLYASSMASEDPPQPQSGHEPEHEVEVEPEGERDGDGDGDGDGETEPEPVVVDVAVEAEKLKELGNESFKRARYGEAVDLYTKAIGMSLSSSSSSSSSFLSLTPSPLLSFLPAFADPNKTHRPSLHRTRVPH
jgi:hypothetical protein